MSKLFDPKCYDLACDFLDERLEVTEAKREDLASTIQQAIEDWLEDRDSEAASARDMAAERDGDEARDMGHDSRFDMYRGELQHQQDAARRLK